MTLLRLRERRRRAHFPWRQYIYTVPGGERRRRRRGRREEEEEERGLIKDLIREV
jgi:hypothetical protein